MPKLGGSNEENYRNCSGYIGLGVAGKDHMAPAKVSPAFEKMKGLVGTWEGKNSMHGKEETTKVIYELTSGGTAIVEKIRSWISYGDGYCLCR